MTEVELVRRAKAGDGAAVAELLSIHATPAFRLALHILRHQADAEDAAQAALLKAFANLGRFDERRPFAPWLLRIVTREALNLRRAERTRFVFWQRHTEVEEGEEAVESAVAVKVEHQELWRAVNELKADDRLLLTLSYFMSLSEADVGSALGIRRGTVKSRKHNALLRLRALVEREFPELRREVLERPVSGEAPR